MQYCTFRILNGKFLPSILSFGNIRARNEEFKLSNIMVDVALRHCEMNKGVTWGCSDYLQAHGLQKSMTININNFCFQMPRAVFTLTFTIKRWRLNPFFCIATRFHKTTVVNPKIPLTVSVLLPEPEWHHICGRWCHSVPLWAEHWGKAHTPSVPSAFEWLVRAEVTRPRAFVSWPPVKP